MYILNLDDDTLNWIYIYWSTLVLNTQVIFVCTNVGSHSPSQHIFRPGHWFSHPHNIFENYGHMENFISQGGTVFLPNLDLLYKKLTLRKTRIIFKIFKPICILMDIKAS